MIGNIKFWIEDRGFGFIDCGHGAEFFFRTGSLVHAVSAGDEVEFWLDDDFRRPGTLLAVDVSRRASGEEPPPLIVAHVRPLPADCSEPELRDALERALGSPVGRVRVFSDRGFGFVRFLSESHLEAVSANPIELRGVELGFRAASAVRV
jgi:cold shock CspA family protein